MKEEQVDVVGIYRLLSKSTFSVLLFSEFLNVDIFSSCFPFRVLPFQTGKYC